MKFNKKCPVCGKSELDEFDYCPVCGWCKEYIAEDYPDEVGAANHLSLNDAKKVYEMGRVDLMRDPDALKKAKRLDGVDALIASVSDSEKQCIGKAIGDRLFFTKELTADSLADGYMALKHTRFDSDEDDEIRLRFIEKVEKFAQED